MGPRLHFRAAAARCRATVAFAGACALVLFSPLTVAAQTNVVMPQTPLLPDHFAGWTSASAATDQAESGLPILSDATFAAVAREDGVGRTAMHQYVHAGKTVSAQAMQFGDATGAVAAFSFLRERQMHESATQPGVHNTLNIATSGTRTLLRDGVSLVVLDGAGGVAPDDLRALGVTLPKISGPKALPPLLPTYLPEENLVAGSMQYAVGPAAYKSRGGVLPPELIGFDKAGEAASAEYTEHGEKGRLTLLLLPTPQIAGDRGHGIEQWMNSPEGKAAGLGSVKLRRVGPMLILVTGGLAPDAAARLADGIHLRTELTWNKPVPPEFHTEVRKTASLLTSIMVLSGVLGLAAVLLGLFLGFGRAWIRVLMGKPAATEPEFLRLDLRSGPGRPVQ